MGHFYSLKNVEMPFPLEMRGFHLVIFQYPLKKLIKDRGNGKTRGNKCAFHQIKNQRIQWGISSHNSL